MSHTLLSAVTDVVVPALVNAAMPAWASPALTDPRLMSVTTAGMPLEVVDILATLIAVLAGCFIVMIPVAGFTARFALKPLIEQIIRLRDGDAPRKEMQALQQRIAWLEQQLQAVEGHLNAIHPPQLPPGPPAPPLTPGGSQLGSSRMGNGDA